MNVELKNLLEKYGCKKSEDIKEMVIIDCKLSILQLRDILLLMGNVLYENLDRKIYVATINYRKTNCIVALKLCDDTISVMGYAKEGIIKRKICEKSFQKLTDAVHGKNNNKPQKLKKIFILILVAVVLVPVIMTLRTFFISETEIEQVLNATKTYNEEIRIFNEYVAEYNSAVELTSIDNIAGLPKKIESLSIVGDERDDIVKAIQNDNNEEKIVSDTETIIEMIEQIKQGIMVVKQITNPEEKWVNERLASIEDIIDTQPVTEEENPDGLLNKEGGYSSCIYFTIAEALPEEVPGNTIVEKGTDAGGAIEIYTNLVDATARVEYLSGFDGTALYSGSYAIVGTMVIRTSYKLSNEQQLQLTNLITTELTKLSEIK